MLTWHTDPTKHGLQVINCSIKDLVKSFIPLPGVLIRISVTVIEKIISSKPQYVY